RSPARDDLPRRALRRDRRRPGRRLDPRRPPPACAPRPLPGWRSPVRNRARTGRRGRSHAAPRADPSLKYAIHRPLLLAPPPPPRAQAPRATPRGRPAPDPEPPMTPPARARTTDPTPRGPCSLRKDGRRANRPRTAARQTRKQTGIRPARLPPPEADG